jgi:bifunctional DNA-binding transcriptional regulator/antitoxin component of YhaV-PrlF toxin-antitoxin module
MTFVGSTYKDYKVGTKGQVVIDQSIREALGIGPGWLAAQLLVGDHLEIRFFPPEHNRSLLGILARPNQPSFTEEELREAGESAWAEAAAEKDQRVLKDARSRTARRKR